jgi:hypothetical protein
VGARCSNASFKSPPTLPAGLPPPPQQLTFTQPPRGRGCSNFRHSFACATKRFPSPRCASAIQIGRPLESIAETQPPTPTGHTELVGDDFLHTFTRFAHQKIVAVSIRHAKLAVTSMAKNKITGGCYCGEVRFSASPEVRVRTNCHCGNCRRAAGAQAVAWITVKRSQFQFVKGTPRRYRTETGAWRTFCSRCGTSLTYEHDKRPAEIDVTTGSLDSSGRFPANEGCLPGGTAALGRSHPSLNSHPHVDKVRPRKDKRGVDLMSDALPFDRL